MTKRRVVCGVLGVVLLCAAAAGAYVWYVRLAPVRHVYDPTWIESHTEKARWEAMQKVFEMGHELDWHTALHALGRFGDEDTPINRK